MQTDAPGARLRVRGVRTNAPGVRVRVRNKSLMLQTNTPALSDKLYAPLFNNKNEE